MKNLVTKIALPGAILAFAMVLFGGTAYAFTNWESTRGKVHIEETREYINKLSERIKELKTEQSTSAERLKTLEAEKNKIEEVKNQIVGEKDNLAKELASLQATYSSKDTENQGLLGGLQRQIEDLRRQIEDKQQEINNKQQEIRDKQQEVLNKQQEVNAKQQEIDAKRQEVEGLHDDEMDKAVKAMEELRNHAKQAVEEAK
ncbi:hypothetical protein [uncultured Leuconostoc sp.]|uniref:hypothetical protein n=1 Tax=uncultured Leuconostoc sp. TaxID=173262 RepID=UPI0025842364|nr:hypothetical protein [uncultured Leuconostoc sp.]